MNQQLINMLKEKFSIMHKMRKELKTQKIKTTQEGYEGGVHYSFHLSDVKRLNKEFFKVKLIIWTDFPQEQRETNEYYFSSFANDMNKNELDLFLKDVEKITKK